MIKDDNVNENIEALRHMSHVTCHMSHQVAIETYSRVKVGKTREVMFNFRNMQDDKVPIGTIQQYRCKPHTVYNINTSDLSFKIISNGKNT